MYRPVLVAPPASTPVTLAEAKMHLRVDHDDEDALISSLISAVTDHLDGWTGILGRCLVEQQWRQDFDAFAQCLPLPLGPVMDIVSVTWRSSTNQSSPVDASTYTLRTDGGGRSFVRFKNSFSAPDDLDERAAVSVTYKAGYETVPPAIKAAMLLHIGTLYERREAVADGSLAELPMGAAMLIAPYRARVG
ncbi:MULTISPECIES: head-tail connector protein [unclassified Bradyrhizobium]